MEFSEWMAYARIYPLGEDRADARTALLASVVANSAGSKKKYQPVDFMPDYFERAEKSLLKKTAEGLQELRSRLAERIKAAFSQFPQANK